MILLLVGFLVTMGIFITGLVTALQLKHDGEEAHWRLYGELGRYLDLQTYEALGHTLDFENSENGKKNRAEFREKIEKLRLYLYPEIDVWVSSMEGKLNFLYDYNSDAKRLNKEEPGTLGEKGKILDDVVKEHQKDSPDYELSFSLKD